MLGQLCNSVLITARKRSYGKVMFLQVSVILFTGGVCAIPAYIAGGIPACLAAGLWGVGGGIPACLAGFQAHTQGGSLGGSGWGGKVSRPTLKGEIEGDLVQAHTQQGSWGDLAWGGGLGAWKQWGVVPAPGGGVWRTPSPHDSYCCGRYASYWNAFLLKTIDSLENGLQPYSGATPLVSIRTESLVSSQSCCNINAMLGVNGP